MSEVYEGRGQMALGYFAIDIMDCSYGIVKPEATLLACSYYSVIDRIELRGSHVAPFSSELDGKKIAQKFYDYKYGEASDNCGVFGLLRSEFMDIFHSNGIIWAPDGDQAFDDGSFVLQFDIDSRVRLLGFRVDDQGAVDVSSFSDCFMEAHEFYAVLQNWASAFILDWQTGVRQIQQ